MENYLLDMKSNCKDVLIDELDEVEPYTRRKFKIIRLPKKEQWHVYGGPEWIYQIVPNEDVIKEKDLVCPNCKIFLSRTDGKNLYCEKCDTEWVV